MKSVEDAKRAFVEAEKGLEVATRTCEDRARAYAEIAPIVNAYKTALENENYWRAEVEEARRALIEAIRAEAREKEAAP